MQQQPDIVAKYTLIPVEDPLSKKKQTCMTIVDEQGTPLWLIRDNAWTVIKVYRFENPDAKPQLLYEERKGKIFTDFDNKKVSPCPKLHGFLTTIDL